MGARFCSLNRKIHYIEVRYIKVWVYIQKSKTAIIIRGGQKYFMGKLTCNFSISCIESDWSVPSRDSLGDFTYSEAFNSGPY